MTTPLNQTTLGLRQYNKDIPPGWRPGAYPIVEYEELISVWGFLTVLEGPRIGAAVFSRLELRALDIARRLTVTRMNATTGELTVHRGIDAVCQPSEYAVQDRNGNVLHPPQVSGLATLLRKLRE